MNITLMNNKWDWLIMMGHLKLGRKKPVPPGTGA